MKLRVIHKNKTKGKNHTAAKSSKEYLWKKNPHKGKLVACSPKKNLQRKAQKGERGENLKSTTDGKMSRT